MNNNEILIIMGHALDIESTDMVEIFKLGGIELSKEDVEKMLIESKEDCSTEDENCDDIEEITKCKNGTLESFLNGFIILKRGKQDLKPGQTETPSLSIKGNKSINNIILKKLKIALSLSSEDMLDIFDESGDQLTKGELSNMFRKEGHTHYKKCDDKHIRNFFEGLERKKI
ncbi:MAG: DUF1456 family protein [Sedimentibacter sp.]